MTDFSIENKVFVITGATGYLGSQMVRDLAAMGARVAVLSRSLQKAQLLAKEFDNKKVQPFEVDIANNESVKACIQAVVESFGAIDVLVNNAYFPQSSAYFDVTDDDWDVSFAGSVKTAHRCSMACLPYLKQVTDGRIINIASMYGMVVPNKDVYNHVGEMNPVTYGVSKAALIHYTKYSAMQLADFAITVNTISYGPFPNPDTVNDDAFLKKLADKTMLKRIGRLSDVSSAVIFLAQSASAYVTGQNIVVDGGWTTW